MQISINNIGTLDDANIVEESMTLQESICSESQLRFGCCEASVFKIRLIAQYLPIVEKDITVSIPYDGQSFQLGKYKVFSDKPTADRKYRDIVAYDAMYDIINADVTDWYNTILPDADSTVTLKELRDSFISYFGLEQEDVSLVNDSMIVTKTIEPSQISGKTVITAICEINGCFGHIGRDGKFQYIFLKEMKEGLYPADTLYPSDDLYPADPMNAESISKSHYISAEYEDFTTERINKLQIRQEENDIGCIYGSGDNCYIVQDNFLLYGKSTEELTDIAAKMYSVISKVCYRPAHVEAKGNPCLEVGDGIRLSTKYAIVYTYILQRTLKGIQALGDTYDADGEQYQTEKVNSVNDSIIQLKGKTNKLIRTIEETRLEIEDIEAGLNSRITQTAESITAEVKRAQGQEVELAAAISINADNINLKVSKGDVSSQLSVESGQVTIKSNRFVLESTNCSITKEGKITAKDVDLAGKITSSSGEIGGFTIGNSSIYKGTTSITNTNSGVYLGTDGINLGGKAIITSAGKASFSDIAVTGNGSIDFAYSSSNMHLDYSGISFSNSSLTTKITSDSVKVYNSYLDKDGLHVRGTISTYYTDIEENLIKFGSGSEAHIKQGNNDMIMMYGDKTAIMSTIAILGKYNSKVGFFGNEGSTKKSITSISSTSSATASACATKINEILTALKAYNLIG